MRKNTKKANEIVEKLLSLVSEYLGDLKAVKDITYPEFKRDTKIRRFVERTLQIAMEACLDIGHHIISEAHFREPESSRDVFRILREGRILSENLLKKMEDMAGFRNLIVHSYARIDPAIVYGKLKRHLKDFEGFINAILKNYLRK